MIKYSDITITTVEHLPGHDDEIIARLDLSCSAYIYTDSPIDHKKQAKLHLIDYLYGDIKHNLEEILGSAEFSYPNSDVPGNIRDIIETIDNLNYGDF